MLSSHHDQDSIARAILEKWRNFHASAPAHKLTLRPDADQHSTSGRYREMDLPKYHIPEGSAEGESVYRVIKEELQLDSHPVQNCATFLSGWMEPEAERLIRDTLSNNLVDQDSNPATQVIHSRCVSMLADLWHAPKTEEEGGQAVGTSVGGSSEGIMLAGLAMKWSWREKMKAAGKNTQNPNIIFGANAQVALEKFGRYFDVESRLVPVSPESKYCLDPKKALDYVDENTIGIIVILGSTYTGHYEPVLEMSEALDDLQNRTGLDIPIHVDGASGGFVAPFAQPHLKWDFQVPRVHSINTSGHKFGLCYPGLGWVVWRDGKSLPKGLIFELHYLGGREFTYTLNFSRPACFVIAQYYNLLRLGKEGYKGVMEACLSNAKRMAKNLEASGYFEVLSDVHRPALTSSSSSSDGSVAVEGEETEPCLPLVAFTFSKAGRSTEACTEYALSALLKTCGWVVPAYELPKDASNIKVLRVVVRDAMSADIVERLVTDILWATSVLQESKSGDGQILSDAVARASERHDDHISRNMQAFFNKQQNGAHKQVTFSAPC
ncbi:MAG: glutamate decarboxylase [Piptocephalis tieghemiana]|nr:MAG: glutamate decarboxylase [Piptocephalis tieghemiana]